MKNGLFTPQLQPISIDAAFLRMDMYVHVPICKPLAPNARAARQSARSTRGSSIYAGLRRGSVNTRHARGTSSTRIIPCTSILIGPIFRRRKDKSGCRSVKRVPLIPGIFCEVTRTRPVPCWRCAVRLQGYHQHPFPVPITECSIAKDLKFIGVLCLPRHIGSTEGFFSPRIWTNRAPSILARHPFASSNSWP